MLRERISKFREWTIQIETDLPEVFLERDIDKAGHVVVSGPLMYSTQTKLVTKDVVHSLQ